MWARQLRVYGHSSKEKAPGKKLEILDPGFSLYSSASEDDQCNPNKDLNGCARLLTEIMDLGGPVDGANKMKPNKAVNNGSKSKTNKTKTALKGNHPNKQLKEKAKSTGKRVSGAKVGKSNNFPKGKGTSNAHPVEPLQDDGKENINHDQPSVSSEASSGIPAFKKPLPDPLNSPVPSDVMQPPKVQKQLVRPPTTYELTRNPATPLCVTANIQSHVPFNTRLQSSTPTSSPMHGNPSASGSVGQTFGESFMYYRNSEMGNISSKGLKTAVASGPHVALGINGNMQVLDPPSSLHASASHGPFSSGRIGHQDQYMQSALKAEKELCTTGQQRRPLLHQNNYMHPLNGQTFPQRMQQLFSGSNTLPDSHNTAMSTVQTGMCKTPGESGYISLRHGSGPNLLDSLTGNVSYGDSTIYSGTESATPLSIGKSYYPQTVKSAMSPLTPVSAVTNQAPVVSTVSVSNHVDGDSNIPFLQYSHRDKQQASSVDGLPYCGEPQKVVHDNNQAYMPQTLQRVIHVPSVVPDEESDQEDTIPTRDPGSTVVAPLHSNPGKMVHVSQNGKQSVVTTETPQLHVAETQTANPDIQPAYWADQNPAKEIQNVSTNQVCNMNQMFMAENIHAMPLSYPRAVPVASMQTQMKTLHFLVRELRAAASEDKEVVRLIGEIEQTIQSLDPRLSLLDWQTEINLALQPLRSENAQLRRQLRILGHQLKDTRTAVEQAEKPDPSLHVLHLEMQRCTLENQIKEGNTKCLALQQKVTFLSTEVDKLATEKEEMLELLCLKDDDHLKSHQDWLEEVTSHRAHAKAARDEQHRLQRENQRLQEQFHLMEIAGEQKDREIKRLNDLVSGLQGSMSKLLNDLQSTAPPGLYLSGLGETPGLAWLHTGAGLGTDSSLSSSSLPRQILEYSPSDHPHHQTVPGHLMGSNVDPHFKQPKQYIPPVSVSHNQPGKLDSVSVSKYGFQPLNSMNQASAGPLSAFGQTLTKDALKQHDEKDATGGTAEYSMYPITEDSSESEHRTPEEVDSLSRAKLYPRDMDSTQYLLPPGVMSGSSNLVGDLPVQGPRPIHHREGGPVGPTVKDVLGSFAEWMRHSLADSMDHTGPANEENQNNEEHGLESAEEDQDNTLTEDQSPPDATETQEDSSSQSRYSVTDYFMKYPAQLKAGLETHKSVSGGSETFPKALHGDFIPGPTKSSSSSSSQKSNIPSSWRKSSQSSLYHGTVLDTSISTIKDTVSSVGTSEMSSSSLATVTSVDEEAFRTGLANLDANIIRIQQSLRNTLKN